MKQPLLMFVYGTLCKGERNHHFLAGARCMEAHCWTAGRLYDTGYGYPAVQEAADEKVYGELYELQPAQLPALDRLEDYAGPGQDNLYNRVLQTVYSDTAAYEAYVYLLHPKQAAMLKQEIRGGDWRKRM